MKRCCFFFFLLLASISFAQKKKTNVILEQSDLLTFDKGSGSSYQVLKGNVRFRHEDALMYCDSAYFYDKNNSFDAFGHVRVVQNSAVMTADKMFYDGNTLLMRIRGQVVAKNEESTLTTDFLDYYRDRNYGHYFNGGKIVAPDYDLTSIQGFYYPSQKMYFFKDSVTLNSSDYLIKSDSMQYNSQTGQVILVGPSYVYGDEYTVYTTNGWTNTQTKTGRLYDYSTITSKDGQRLTADSIFYDSNVGSIKAYHRVDLLDPEQKIIIRGDYAEYNKTFPASAIVTKNPYIIEFSENDSLFLGADTLFYKEIDSLQKEVRAFHHVKFYRNDLQGMCDSLVYVVQDSVAIMYDSPIIWTEENQMTGEEIRVYMKNEAPDWLHIPKNAMIVSKEGLDNYNQLSGKESKAYIEDGKLRKVDMIGDAESIYYSKDDDEALIGINKAKGSLMSIYMKNKKLNKIIMTPDSEGILYPPDKMPKDEKYLRNFSWKEILRPRSKEDIIKR